MKEDGRITGRFSFLIRNRVVFDYLVGTAFVFFVFLWSLELLLPGRQAANIAQQNAAAALAEAKRAYTSASTARATAKENADQIESAAADARKALALASVNPTDRTAITAMKHFDYRLTKDEKYMNALDDWDTKIEAEIQANRSAIQSLQK